MSNQGLPIEFRMEEVEKANRKLKRSARLAMLVALISGGIAIAAWGHKPTSTVRYGLNLPDDPRFNTVVAKMFLIQDDAGTLKGGLGFVESEKVAQLILMGAGKSSIRLQLSDKTGESQLELLDYSGTRRSRFAIGLTDGALSLYDARGNPAILLTEGPKGNFIAFPNLLTKSFAQLGLNDHDLPFFEFNDGKGDDVYYWPHHRYER